MQLSSWRVRGITRNPSGAAAQALASEGVEIVQGDLDDKTSLISAFQGATVIFSNTDFFAHAFYAMSPNANLLAGKTPNEYACEREVEQGLNVSAAATDSSVLKTLERFVLSSLCDARKLSSGKYKTVYHFDSKTEIVRLTRQRFPGLAARMSIVQLGHYTTNWRKFSKLAPQKQADGSFVISRTEPPDFKMPHVVAERDTGAFVKALVNMPPGKTLLAVSEYMTFPEFAEVWGRVHGVRATYKQISNEELFEGLPVGLMEEMRDDFDFIHEFGFTGGDPNVLEPSQVRCAMLKL